MFLLETERIYGLYDCIFLCVVVICVTYLYVQVLKRMEK